jgi:aryl-alcohol dehydrogenase-like predicted oxidoreductase
VVLIAVDLLYQHHVDPNVPIEDVAGTVKGLIAEGNCWATATQHSARFRRALLNRVTQLLSAYGR